MTSFLKLPKFLRMKTVREAMEAEKEDLERQDYVLFRRMQYDSYQSDYIGHRIEHLKRELEKAEK